MRREDNGAFYIVYSEEYASLQESFEARQLTNDPEAIAQLLQAHPFHVDTLLQMVRQHLL